MTTALDIHCAKIVRLVKLTALLHYNLFDKFNIPPIALEKHHFFVWSTFPIDFQPAKVFSSVNKSQLFPLEKKYILYREF